MDIDFLKRGFEMVIKNWPGREVILKRQLNVKATKKVIFPNSNIAKLKTNSFEIWNR